MVPSRDPSVIDLTARFTEHVTLRRPLVSANMDTITRAAMATVLAEEGGIGVIDRGFRAGDIVSQVTEVAAVKRTQHGIIGDPHTIDEQQRVRDAVAVMERTHVGTLVVVDEAKRLKGLLTERDVRFVPGDAPVAERMTPLDRLVVHTGQISLADAERVMAARKIKKLPLVNPDGSVLGLITARDLIKHREHPFATRDERGRLRVAAAVGATGDYLERASEVVRAGADVIVIDVAHGHSLVMERALGQIKKRLPEVDVIAGNVATAEGARVPGRAWRERRQGGHRTRRRLHDATVDQFRRPAGRGDRAMPDRGRRARADHRRWGRAAARQHCRRTASLVAKP